MKTLVLFFLFALFAICANAAEISSLWPLPKELAEFDKNGDKLLKGDEITKELMRFDLNKDGIITPSEALFVLSQDEFTKNNPDYKEPRFGYPMVFCSSRPADVSFDNTILVSVDGFDRAVVQEMLENNRLPTFLEISQTHFKNSFVVNVTLTGHQTETKTGHAVMLTGLIPEFSRVQTNKKFQPIPKGLTIFERIKAARPDVKTVFVSSKRENVGAMSAEELGNRVEDGIKIEGGPYLNAKDSIDVFSATDKTTKEAKDVFIESLEKVKGGKFFAFLHFRDPDRPGHRLGRESKEYRDSVEQIDSHLNEILEWLSENNLAQNTRIIITADHGFEPDAKKHHYAPWITCITNDSSMLTYATPNLFDIPATIMAAFGVDLETLDPKPFGKDIRKMK